MPDMLDDDWVSPVKPDPQDERDQSYDLKDDPGWASRQLPDSVSYAYYAKFAEPRWWQRGEECTGFALAAIANHLIRSDVADTEPSVSPRMMYEMAQEYDEAAYEEGSTLRGALKGWAKLGIASMESWPYDPDDEHGEVHGTLNLGRVADAGLRPMGPYRRIAPHTDIAKMQATLARHNPLFASAILHTGWFRLYLPGSDGVIRRHAEDKDKGGHAFVIVGYDEQGFWIHNSFGEDWGKAGYGLITYDDWLTTGSDVWVPSLGRMERTAPQTLEAVPSIEVKPAADAPTDTQLTPSGANDAHALMWPHVIPIGDDGRLSTVDDITVDAKRVKTLFYVFGEQTKGWKSPRLALIADAGMRAADIGGRLRQIRDRLMQDEIYPIFLVWSTPWLESMKREIDKTLMADGSSLGDLFTEVGLPKTNAIPLWREVTRRAHLASCRICQPEAAGRFVADSIAYKHGKRPFEIHLVAHSSGDLLLSELAAFLPTPIRSASLWAPATPMAQFRDTYLPMLEDGCLRSMNITALDTNSETSDHTGNYGNSPLVLISNVLAVPGADSPALHHFGPEGEAPDAASLEETQAWFMARKLDPEPLLGLEADLRRDETIRRLRLAGALSVDFVLYGSTHESLLSDEETLKRTINRIAPPGPPASPPVQEDTHEIQVIIELPNGDAATVDPLMSVADVE